MYNITPKLTSEEYENNFADIKPPLTKSAAIVEAGRCLFCFDAPCTSTCPTHIDVPRFIKKIVTRNFSGSAKTILEENILGESCSRVCPVEMLCEGACVMNDKGESPIQIGRLQRFAMEWRRKTGVTVIKARKYREESVGLVGAGPASLSCATHLARFGYNAIIYEAEDIPGGLDSTGIAAYKLRMKDVLYELELIKELGVKIVTGARIGIDLEVKDLLENHDAIFIGTGLERTHKLRIPGVELDGVMNALSFIKRVKTIPFDEIEVGQRVIVLGGGNTAMDAAIASRRLGAKYVTIVYRRSEMEMPAYKHEYDLAKSDGILFQWLTAPIEFFGDGSVEGVKCVRMKLDKPDDSGRRYPIPVEDSEFTIRADMCLLALGQEADMEFLNMLPDIEVANGLLVTNQETGQTSNPRIFAGGDLVHGAKEVVNAVQAGKLAALGIDTFLKGRKSDHG